MGILQSFDPVLIVRLVLVALAVFLCFLAALTWERRQEALESTSFALLLLCGALYTFGYSSEVAATTLPHALFWLHVEFLALPFIPPLWLLTAIRHNGKRFSIGAIFAIPVLCFAAHVTNHWHGWFYLSVDFVRQGPFWELSFKRGPFALLENTYLLFSFVAAAWLYLAQLRNGSPLFRKQAMIMLASSILPVTFYFLFLCGLSPWHLDITPFSFPLCAALYYYGVFWLGVFDLTPTARNLVFQGMRDAVLIIDNRSRLLDFNPAAAHLLPSLDNLSVGRQISELLADHPSLLGLLYGTCSGELVLQREEATRYFDVRAFPLLSGKRTLGHASILADITEQARLREELRTHAETDALTGVANRRRFLDSLAATCHNAAKLRSPLSLLLIDLDHFKSINDRFGHPTGDAVLFVIAGRLQSCLRAGDLLARYGGEEFSILLPATDTEAALDCAECVLAAVSTHPVTVDSDQLPLTVSIGLVTLHQHDGGAHPDPALLLKQADLALYRAKAEGRNRVVVASGTALHAAASTAARSVGTPTNGRPCESRTRSTPVGRVVMGDASEQPLLRPRMGVVVDPLHLSDGELGVTLRRRKTLVAEHLLDRAQVRAILQHVRPEGMPQRVRMHVGGQAARLRDRLDDAPDAARGEPAVAAHAQVGQQRPILDQPALARRAHLRLALRKVRPKRDGRLVPQRNVALLARLAPHQDGLVLPLDVLDVDAHQLGVADAAAVEQLEDDAVALRPRRGLLRVLALGALGVERVQHAIHILGAGHPRQVQGALRRRHQQRGILRHLVHLSQPFEPRAHRRKRPRNARLGQPAIVQKCHVGTDMQVFDGIHPALFAKLFRQKIGKAPHLPRIRAHGVLGGATLVAQHGEKAIGQQDELIGTVVKHQAPTRSSRSRWRSESCSRRLPRG